MIYMSDRADPMEPPFSAEMFVALLKRGVFEGKLTEQIEKLSYEQLEQVAVLMAKQMKEKKEQ